MLLLRLVSPNELHMKSISPPAKLIPGFQLATGQTLLHFVFPAVSKVNSTSIVPRPLFETTPTWNSATPTEVQDKGVATLAFQISFLGQSFQGLSSPMHNNCHVDNHSLLLEVAYLVDLNV